MIKYINIDRIDGILVAVLILALWAILAIQMKVIPTINIGWEAETAKSVNDVFLNLSYSYIAALIFYGLTTRLTAYRRKKKLLPVIQKRVEQIGRLGIYYILLKFSRGSGYGADYKSSENTAKVLESKNWLDYMPFFQKAYRVNMTYLELVSVEGKKIKERVSDLIDKYKDEMTTEQITLLKDIPNMYLFRLVDLFCAIPNNTIDKGNNPFIEEFCKLHDKYLEVERAFGISVNQQSGINFTIRS